MKTKTLKAMVDSGQLIIIDPCYLREHMTEKSFTKFYNKCCKATRSKSGRGTVHGGVAFSTGGDGSFPVKYSSGKNGIQLEMNFT